jgi:lysophospholipase L1-like esterase
VPFEVRAGDELAVSFEVNGALSAASIGNFPGSYARTGNHSHLTSSLGGSQHPRMVGLATIDVEGPRSRAAVAIGDSITEGYVSGATTSGTGLSSGYLAVKDDYRNAWNAVASSLLGGPVVNAGVSGQGTWDAQQNLEAEVLALEGLTDCVVLLGTNDLGGLSVTQLQGRLQQLFDTLAPKCRVWAGTLLPKERTSAGSLSLVQADRKAINAWLRTTARVYDVIDFEAATQSQTSIDLFYPGFGEDGIHPSVEGHDAMGRAAANALVEDPSATGAASAGAP